MIIIVRKVTMSGLLMSCGSTFDHLRARGIYSHADQPHKVRSARVVIVNTNLAPTRTPGGWGEPHRKRARG